MPRSELSLVIRLVADENVELGPELVGRDYDVLFYFDEEEHFAFYYI